MNMNKLLFVFAIGLVLMLPIAFAEENDTIIEDENDTIIADENDTEIIPPENETIPELPDPGITPDNPLYGLDRAIERIDLLLTFNKAEKAKKGLVYARERLAEVQAMIAANKADAAEDAADGYNESITEVEANIEDLEETNSTEELETVVELEGEINLNRMYVEHLGEGVLVKTKGNITAEQQAMIDAIGAAMTNQTGHLKIEINNKKEEVKVKIKVEGGMTEEQVDALEANIGDELIAKGKSGVLLTKQEKEKEQATDKEQKQEGEEESDQDQEQEQEGQEDSTADDSSNGKGKSK